jgi:hypothetical protein
VPNVSGIAALDVLIGLFFLYFLLSIVCSSMNEAIAAVLNMRAAYLEDGIRALLSREGNVKAFYSSWRMRTLIKPPGRFFKRPRKPSYIPPRTFALTLLDTFAPPTNAAENDDLIGRAQRALGAPEEDSESRRPTEIVRGLLRDALAEAQGDRDRFTAAIEQSFDDVMDRASGWYKRRVQLILFVLALGLVCVINADSSALAQRLWKDDALRAAVVSQANEVVQTGRAECTQGAGETRADAAAKCVDEVNQFGLPLGWSHATSPHNVFWDGFGKGLGLLVTAFALTLGAPFWFDLLGKVSRLRASGPPVATESKPR